MKQLSLALALLALVGCQNGNLPVLGGSPAPGTGQGDRAEGRYGGLAFRALTQEGATWLGGGSPSGMLTSGPVPTAAQAEQNQAMARLGSALSYYGTYSGGAVPLKLDRVTEATAPGMAGSLKQVVERIVQPVLGEWAPDASLVVSSGFLAPDGQPVGSGSSAGGWALAYSSDRFKESMLFLVTPQTTRVLLLRWVPVTIDLGTVTIDSDQAVQQVLAAVKDPTRRSREDELGLNLFMLEFGATGPYGNPTLTGGIMPTSMPMVVGLVPDGIATLKPTMTPTPSMTPSPGPLLTPTPSVSPTPWATYSAAPIATYTPRPYYHQPSSTTEVLTTLPPGGSWTVRLNPLGKYLVWDMSYYGSYVPSTFTTKTDGTYTATHTNSYVSAWVDARTGALLRLYRPTRTTTTTTLVYGPVMTPSPILVPLPHPSVWVASGSLAPS